MSLSRQDKQALRFIWKKFPVPDVPDARQIRIRNRHQPATADDVRCALNVAVEDCTELLERLTTYGLIVRTYWYGSDEVARVATNPGNVIAMPVTAQRPASVNPDDERYGNYCYQISEAGITELHRQGKLYRFFADHYWKVIVPITIVVVGGMLAFFLKPQEKPAGSQDRPLKTSGQ